MFSSLGLCEVFGIQGELIRIKEFVDPVLEIAEVTDRVSKMPGGGKALSLKTPAQGIPF